MLFTLTIDYFIIFQNDNRSEGGMQRQQRSRPVEFEAWEPRAVTPLCPPAVSQSTARGVASLFPLCWWSASQWGASWPGSSRRRGNQSGRVMEPEPLARSHIYYRSTRPIDCHSLAPTYISNKYNLVNYTNTGTQQATKPNQSRI